MTSRRKKASISQMLNETQEEDLSDWCSDNPGLYNKSCAIYCYKAKKNKLIADKAASMEVRGFDATMLHVWMKSMRTMYGKVEKKSKGKS